MEKTDRKLVITTLGGITTAKFVGHAVLSQGEVEDLKEELLELVTGPLPRVVLSFSGVQFLSSAALRVLLLFDRRLHAKNGILRLANISDKILEVFQITRLDKYFEIYPTLLEARGSFGD